MTYWENPLQSKRHTPRPLILAPVVRVCHASNENTSDGPTHLQRSCASTAKGKRDDLTSIGWRIGDKEAPRNALESLANDENFERVGLGLYGQMSCASGEFKVRLTKKEMKMVAFMSTNPNKVVQRYPRTLVIGPAMKTPTNAPHCPAWNSEDCHLVSIAYTTGRTPGSDTTTPYLSWKCKRATKLPLRNISKLSMTL